MNDTQPYNFESEGTLEEEDDSDCFEEMYITTSRMAEILTLKSNYNSRQSIE